MFLQYILNESADSMINRFFKTQLKCPTPKDWVKTVENDLKDLKIGLSFEEIKNFKKVSLKRMLNKAVINRALQRLNTLKEKHSKVAKLNHSTLKMQNYLKGNRNRISQNISELIFKMRSKVTKVKMNEKGSFENLNCAVCNEEKECQKHIMNCKKILEMRKNDHKEVTNYEKIFGENVKSQIKIAKYFEENLKIKNKLERMI